MIAPAAASRKLRTTLVSLSSTMSEIPTPSLSRVGRAILTGLILQAWLVAGIAGAADDAVVYTRADVAVAVTGEASFRRAYTQRVELLWPDCPGEPFTCKKDVVYGQIYEIALTEETLTRTADDAGLLERSDRGSVWIAVEFPVDVERTFEEGLVEHLETLAVASYTRPQAGIAPWRGRRFRPFRRHRRRWTAWCTPGRSRWTTGTSSRGTRHSRR